MYILMTGMATGKRMHILRRCQYLKTSKQFIGNVADPDHFRHRASIFQYNLHVEAETGQS